MKTIITITLLSVVAFCCSCTEKDCFTPPEVFRLVVHHSDGTSAISADNQSNVKLFIVTATNNTIEMAIDVLQHYDSATDINTFYIETAELPWKSLDGNKNFLLKIGDSSANLFVDVTAQTVDRCAIHPYNLVSYNGTPVNEYNSDIGAFVATE